MLLAGAASVQTPAMIATVAHGERRAYDIKWRDPYLVGTPHSPELGRFELAASEVRLPDISVSFDREGTTGKIYRLYQAAFGRTPDVAGFGFWKHALENRGLRLEQIANDFLESAESKTLYGAHSDDRTFVLRLYQNVLHRAPDADGEAFWINALKSGTRRVDVLLGFSESAENKAATEASAKAGMAFAEPGIAYNPVSNAIAPSDVPVGALVKLDAATSTDANGDALRYSWSITAKPAGSMALLNNPNAAISQFFPDKAGSYELVVWVSDGLAQSYSPAKVKLIAHSNVADSGTYTCANLSSELARTLYATGHRYLDRNKDGVACNSGDAAYESALPVKPIVDTGMYKCSAISRETSVLLYSQGHTYLDRDKDGKPCEASDLSAELSADVTSPSTGGKCWVNGYTRKNGTRVSGYWRRC